jgi:hypothetical protein
MLMNVKTTVMEEWAGWSLGHRFFFFFNFSMSVEILNCLHFTCQYIFGFMERF